MQQLNSGVPGYKQQYSSVQQPAYQQYQQPGTTSPQMVPSIPQRGFVSVLDKRMIIPLLVIILVLMLAWVSYSYIYQQSSAEEISESRVIVKDEAASLRDTTPDCDSVCEFEKAVATLDTRNCDTLPEKIGNASSERCKFEIAEVTGKLNVCFLIDEWNGEFGKNRCIYEMSRLQLDEDVCGFIAFSEAPYDEESCRSSVKTAKEEHLAVKLQR